MIDIKMLQKCQRYLSISAICKDAGLNHNTIRAKIHRGTELNVKESQKIEDALQKVGIKLITFYDLKSLNTSFK